MPTPKKPKKPTTPKVFDVSKPSQNKPSATSKPVIVGHKPMRDPLLKASEPATAAKDDLADFKVSPLGPPEPSKITKVNVVQPDATDTKIETEKPAEGDTNAESKTDEAAALSAVSLVAATSNDDAKASEVSLPEGSEDIPSLSIDEEQTESPDSLETVVAEEPTEPQQPIAKSKAEKTNAATSKSTKAQETKTVPTEQVKSDTQPSASDQANPAAVDSVLGEAQGIKQAEAEAASREQKTTELAKSGKYTVPISSPPHHHKKGGQPALLLLILLIVVAALGYLAIDAGIINTNFKLPYHFFKQTETSNEATPTPPPATKSTTPPSTSTTPTTSTTPAGFSSYKVTGAALAFDAPTVWGEPTEVGEKGYSQRSTTAASDGNYAYLVTFAKNKDVQMVVTSGTLLPAARATQYYDFLQWCTLAKDGKTYKQKLTYKTTAGVDKPDVVTCDQGPLTDAVSLNTATISQLKTTFPDGSALGDLYTKNLANKMYPVLRVKDATGKNADTIKKLIDTVQTL